MTYLKFLSRLSEKNADDTDMITNGAGTSKFQAQINDVQSLVHKWGIYVFSHNFEGIIKLKYSLLLALSIPLILCNKGCKVFKCTEDFI